MTDWIRGTGLLLRIRLLRLAGVNSLIHGHDRRQRLRALGTLALCLLVCAMAVGYSAVYMIALSEMGALDAAAHVYAIVIAMLAFGAVGLKGPALIFGGDDVEMLRAMPVPTAAIAASRLLSVLLPELLFALLIAVPAAVSGVCLGMEPGKALRFAAAMLLIPALPTAAALMVGVLVSWVTRRMRHRALVSGVLSMALMALVLSGVMALGAASGTGSITEQLLMVKLGRAAELVRGLYPPADWAYQAMNGHAAGFAWLLLSAAAALAAVCLFVTLGFTRVCDALASASARSGVRRVRVRCLSPVLALLGKEWQRLVSCGVYMMNTMMGAVLIVLMAAAVCVMNLRPYVGMLRFVPVIGGQALALLPLIPAFAAGVMQPTACAVSLEGQQMVLLRAMPVRMRDWLGAKVLLALCLYVPALLAGGAVAVWRLGLSGAPAALMMIYPTCAAAFAAVCSLAMNLLFPRFDWEQEVQAVKQGAAVLLAMLIGLLTQIAVAALAIVTGRAVLVMGAAAGVQLVGAAALFALLCRRPMPE
ncbi:MAG: hypothetical protein J6K32_03565 [Clostridia bacterium]|nr:hypothetical protein [Clostridia bacterium]